MEREVLFLTIAAALFCTVVWTLAVCLRGKPKAGDLSERRAWWRLAWPFLAGVLLLAFFIGWVSQEPDPSDEWVAKEWFVLAGLAAIVALRAAWRAFRSLKASGAPEPPIATTGLLHCRISVSDRFRESAREQVLAAALAHEEAHARGRDPLRMLLGQVIADLQWPAPGSRRRLKLWLLALELRRDDEAVAAGASPVDLAEGMVVAARLALSTRKQPLVAAVDGDGAGLALRVRRLLRDGRALARVPQGREFRPGIFYVPMVLAATWIGMAYGDVLLGILPGVGR